jgi:hypothetical protein
VIHSAPAHTIAPAHPIVPGTIIPPGKGAEPIKKMPNPDTKDKDNKGALLLPSTSVTPTGGKVETDNKNPF